MYLDYTGGPREGSDSWMVSGHLTLYKENWRGKKKSLYSWNANSGARRLRPTPQGWYKVNGWRQRKPTDDSGFFYNDGTP